MRLCRIFAVLLVGSVWLLRLSGQEPSPPALPGDVPPGTPSALDTQPLPPPAPVPPVLPDDAVKVIVPPADMPPIVIPPAGAPRGGDQGGRLDGSRG